MFWRAFLGALSRRRWASALTQRNAPLARPTSPSGTALAEKSSNTVTGSGLDHSPKVHALYQPTEPEVARRTSASQLDKRTTAFGPLAWKPSWRFSPPGSVASIPPQASRRSIWSSTLEKAGAVARATRPPPVAKPRSARTRCSPRVLMARQLCIHLPLVEGNEEAVAAEPAPKPNRNRVRPKRSIEALVRQIGAPVDVNHDGHSRPDQESADVP